MTDQENKVLDLSAQLWSEFLKLPRGHEDDVPDFRFHVHALQRIVIARGFVKQQQQEAITTEEVYVFGQKEPVAVRQFANIDTSSDVTMPARTTVVSVLMNP